MTEKDALRAGRSKWERRERKLQKRRHGMRVSNRSLRDVILPAIIKRGREAEEKQRDAQ